MKHDSAKTIESKALPGVRFVIKKMTKRRTDQLEELTAPFQESLRPLYQEFTPLNDERNAAKEAGRDFDKLGAWGEVWQKIWNIEQKDLEPIYASFCLVRIEDLEITYPDAEGRDVTEPATLDLLMEHGPDELYEEIVTAIKRECKLLPEEVENLDSPSTLAAQVDGSQENADLAAKPETITLSAA